MLLWEKVSGKNTPTAVVNPTTPAVTKRLRSMRQENRCAALTRIGRRCRCRKTPGSDYCAFHDPVVAAGLRERAAAKRDARKRQLDALPEGYLQTLTSANGIASALERLYREVRLGVVPPRTAAVLLAIVDRLLEYDKLVSTVGPRQVRRKQRAREVRQQLKRVLDDLGIRDSVSTGSHAAPSSLVPAGEPARVI